MADRTKIEWTDATWNPVRGCTKVSPGCKHCYAETFAERFRGVKGHPFELLEAFAESEKNGPLVFNVENLLLQPTSFSATETARTPQR